MSIICEIKLKSGKTKRVKTTWDWYMNYGYRYTVAILMP